MEKLNKPFEPITTLIIIYFALVAVSIALYALIQIFFKSDTATASSLLGWTATMFATIALLYTFNSWKDQKRNEEIAKLSKETYINLKDRYDLVLDIASHIDTVNLIDDYKISIDDAKKINRLLNIDLNFNYELLKIRKYCSKKEIIDSIDIYIKDYKLIQTYIGELIFKELGFQDEISKSINISNVSDFMESYKTLTDSLFEVSVFNS
ncbi:hypothetical protein [Acinetobacter sp. YH12064]|uniref:hypothetical protein n=1 Tax=Acinetobacter sp. YH12064 TaxID=2601062 RepID=UPI0015D3F8AF|nr:hypothetical protein [Acinetobacter sp. YH12064]